MSNRSGQAVLSVTNTTPQRRIYVKRTGSVKGGDVKRDHVRIKPRETIQSPPAWLLDLPGFRADVKKGRLSAILTNGRPLVIEDA
jgi:hypothetical protein